MSPSRIYFCSTNHFSDCERRGSIPQFCGSTKSSRTTGDAMDDLQPLEFDVAGFVHDVSAGAGDGRISSAAAARSTSNVLRATKALSSFAGKAKSGSSDVIAAYLALVPQATQLFAPLWLADQHPNIASAALDVLIQLARYARAGKAPEQAVTAARSVVKDIVKGRAPNVFHVVKNDEKLLAKKVLVLLEIVAASHRILAKEVVHRFDLTSPAFQVLCNKYNKICRTPFLKLVTTLLASGDHDLVWYLSTRGKNVLNSCAIVVSYQASHKAGPKLVPKEAQQSDGKLDEGQSAKRRIKSDATARDEASELVACIAFLNAVRDNILSCPNENTLRAALEPPFVDHLATVAATELQIEEGDLSVASIATRKTLRDLSTAIFLQIGKSRHMSKPILLARAVGSVPIAHSTTALQFVLNFVEACPHVAIPMLQTGPYLTSQPSATSAWLSQATVIMLCTKQLTNPTTAFVKHYFFERTLNHASALVQHVGVLVTTMLCRLAEQDASFAQTASSFLPPLRFIDKLLRKYPGDRSIHSVFSTYRKIFPKEFIETKTDAIRLSVEASGQDISVTEATIRACLSDSRESALNSIFQKKLLSALIKAAWCQNTKPATSTRIWSLVQCILQATNLFPAQSCHEIDLWLAALTAQGDDRESCLQGLEQLLQSSWKQPYALFDDASGVQNSSNAVNEIVTQKNSLLTAAALRRLSKLQSLDAKIVTKEAASFAKYLACVATVLISWDVIVGRENTKELVIAKLKAPSAAGISLLDRKKTHKQLDEAVQSLQSLRPCNLNADFFALREICTIGELLSSLYKRTDLTSLSELNSIWAACCAGIGDLPAGAPIGCEFFSKHWALLVKSNSGHRKTVEGFLRLLCVRHISSASAKHRNLSSDESMQLLEDLLKENMSLQDRCIFLTVFLRSGILQNFRDNALSAAMEILSGMQRNFANQVIETMFAESVLLAIKASPRIHRKYAESILKNVVDNFGQFEALSSREDQIAWAQPLLRILAALATHSDAGSQLYVANALTGIGAEKQLMIARLGEFAWQPFVSILQNIPSMAIASMQVIVAMESSAIRAHPEAYLPILAFLSKRREKNNCGLTCDYLTTIAVGGSWQFQDRAGFRANESRGILKSAYEFGANIAIQQSSANAIAALIENGPSSDIGPASIWWAIGCGLLSGSSIGDETEKAARNLLQLIVLQLTNNEESVLPWVHFGPVHAIKNLLALAPAPKGHVKHHSEEYEDTKRLCNFLQAAFKTTGVSLMRAVSEDDYGEQKSNVSQREIHTLMELATLLECIERVNRVQELSVNLNRLVLHSFGEFSNCFAYIGDRSRKRTDALRAACSAVLHSFAKIIGTASNYLYTIGMDARSALALTKIEEVFCQPSFSFFASASAFDRDVIDAMSTIRSCLKKGDFRRMKGLPDYRARFFAPLAANVVPILKPGRLRATSMHILEQHQCSNLGQRKTEIFPSDCNIALMPYDPAFVLRVLRLGAEYAVYCRNSAVLDLGLVTSGGLLRVAISAIASPNEGLRTEAYAALDGLSKAVGPEYGNLQGSAATLYKDRIQVAFMLQVLKDSVGEPLQQVPPLFASWFHHALRILLRPTHGAYTSVMRNLLRQPVLDVNDCEGVIHLLHSTNVGSDVKAMRLLALDIIEDGMWSLHDHHVARRRRIYDSVLMLAGSALGADPAVRDKAVRVLSIVPKRFPHGQVALQLCRMHAFGSCLVPQHTDPVENRVQHLMLRCGALSAVVSSLPDDHDQDEHAICLSNTLRVLVQALETSEHGNLRLHDVKRIIDCAMAISRLANRLQKLHEFNFKFVHKQLEAVPDSLEEKEDCKNSLALLMTQHALDNPAFSIIERLWDSIGKTWALESDEAKKPSCSGRIMAEAYLARVIIRKSPDLDSRELERAVFETAKVLSNEQSSIWTIVASIALLCRKSPLSSLVLRVAELVPGVVPNRLDDDIEQRYDVVKKEFSARVLAELIQFGSSLRESAEKATLTLRNVDRSDKLVRTLDAPFASHSRKRARRE